MENRFLEHSRRLGQTARPRAPHAAGGNGRPWAAPFSAADRTLLVLIENGGVDLGIPTLVDKLLASIPGADVIPESYRQSLVAYLRGKITELTDNLLETAELTLNRYAAAKPDLFGEVAVLRDGTASYDELKGKLVALGSAGRIVDLLVLTHGGADHISVQGGIDGQRIRAMKDALGKPLTLRSVYMMNCVGSSLNQAWLDAGAKVSSGALRNNYLPEPTTYFFWESWKAGQTFETAVTGSYRKTIQLMNDVIRPFLTGLPIPGAGTLAASLDVESLDFVRDSAPVIQGQRSVTITSDELTVAQSRASSLSTTVLPAAFLRTLSDDAGTPASGRPARSLSPEGVDFIKRWEGFRERMYNDPVGHCTVGYGTLLHMGNCDGSASEQPYVDGVTEAQATELLAQGAAQFQQTINDSLSVPLTQSQNDALVSFTYNVGTANFLNSTLLRVLNEGKYDAVPAELRKWTKARQDGELIELPGLVKRRAAEAELFARPVPDAGAAQSLSGLSSDMQVAEPFLIGGMGVGEALQVGLAGVSVVQASIKDGSFSLTYPQAQRILTTEAREAMQGSVENQTHTRNLFFIGAGPAFRACANIFIEWEGNAFGEIGTVMITKDLDTSTDWSRSSADIRIVKRDPIPEYGSDPRTWPIVYAYDGTYDPWGNGHFEFTGEFQVNAFGGLVFSKPHHVVSRSAADFAIAGTPEDYVRKGDDVIVPVPEVPEAQLTYLKDHLNAP
jgi:GH24 family phage-related lysozyme (muramidase)